MIFVDGFDHYNDFTEATRKWDSTSGITSSLQATGGRNNSGYLKLGGIISAGFARKHFAATKHIVLQYGIRVAYGGGNNWTLCNLTSPLGGNHSAITLLGDGSIRYMRGTTQLAISPGGTLSGGVWHYLEMEQTLSNTVGTLVLKLNGDIIFNLSGLNNNDDTVEFPTQMTINGSSDSGGTSSIDFDDLVLVTGNTAGSTEAAPFNTLFGDWAVHTLWPDGAGSRTDFTPVPVVANHLNVDETYPDDDTTYNEGGVVGNQDLYAMTNLPATVTAVLSTTTTPTQRKNDAGTRQFRGLIHRAGTTNATGDIKTATVGYNAGLQNTFRFDPITGIAPTPAQVNAYESGIEVVT